VRRARRREIDRAGELGIERVREAGRRFADEAHEAVAAADHDERLRIAADADGIRAGDGDHAVEAGGDRHLRPSDDRDEGDAARPEPRRKRDAGWRLGQRPRRLVAERAPPDRRPRRAGVRHRLRQRRRQRIARLDLGDRAERRQQSQQQAPETRPHGSGIGPPRRRP
jgi:hypothetical protein